MNDETRRRSHLTPRRRFLQLLGAGTVGLAGCLGDGDDASSDDSPSDDEGASGGDDDGNEATDEDATDDQTGNGGLDDGEQSDGGESSDDEDATPMPETDLPITGEPVPELAGFDETMVSIMEEFDIGAGALGVAREGGVVLERGYGWADGEETTETAPDSLFRIGSISKSLTRAAVYELVDSGKLSYDEPVEPLLTVDPPGGEPVDDRFSEITVRDLVGHRAGLPPSRGREFEDPVFVPRAVADHLGKDTPPTTEDFVRYLLDQELAYDPGTSAEELAFDPYSNSGYVVLTHVVASVAGESYQSYLESEILPMPDGINVAQADPTQRPAREVSYHSPRQYPSALDPDSDEEVPWADGGFLLAPIVGAGGHNASTRGLLAFMREYWAYYGEPRSNDVELDSPAALGSIPGTLAVAYHHDDSTEVVALFNRRPQNPREWNGVLRDLAEAAAAVETWPN